MKKQKNIAVRVDFAINDLRVCLCVFVISKYQNSPPQLLEDGEHNSDTYSRRNVL